MMLPLSESVRVTRAYNQSLGLRLSEEPPPPVKKCHYCPRPGVTRDHIVAKALGGPNGQWNIVPACKWCNGNKGDRWPTCSCTKCSTARRNFIDMRIRHSQEVVR